MVKEIGLGLLLTNANPVLLLVVAAAAKRMFSREEDMNMAGGAEPSCGSRESEMA